MNAKSIDIWKTVAPESGLSRSYSKKPSRERRGSETIRLSKGALSHEQDY